MKHADQPVHPSSAKLPPGPDLSAEDQARIWLERPCALLESCQRAYGDMFTLRLGGFGTIVIVTDADIIRQIFAAPPDWYECGAFNDSYRYAMGDGALFLQDGDAHRRLKRMIAPPFRGDRLGAQAAAIARITAQAIDGWRDGDEVRLRPMLHDITLRSLLTLVLGDSEAARAQILDWFRDEVWTDMRSWKPWTRLSRLHRRIRPLLADELDLRRRRGPDVGTPDLLSMLLAARDDAGEGLSDAEIQDQVLMLTITAGDAVAVATAWGLWRAATEPEAQDRLRADTGAAPDPAALARRPYLTAFAQEVLRLHTVLPTVSGRRLTAPREIGGYLLDAGVTLAPCEYLAHRRAETFEDPAAFRPDRFIGRSYPPNAYFPFGGGQRSCLGGHLAPMTVKLIMATILSQARLSPLTDKPPEVVRYGTLLAPDETLTLKISDLRQFPR